MATAGRNRVNLSAKTRKTGFYLKNYTFESIFKFLDNPTIGPVHLELFCPFASEVLDLYVVTGISRFIDLYARHDVFRCIATQSIVTHHEPVMIYMTLKHAEFK